VELSRLRKLARLFELFFLEDPQKACQPAGLL
jgi:hypothetical protein